MNRSYERAVAHDTARHIMTENKLDDDGSATELLTDLCEMENAVRPLALMAQQVAELCRSMQRRVVGSCEANDLLIKMACEILDDPEIAKIEKFSGKRFRGTIALIRRGPKPDALPSRETRKLIASKRSREDYDADDVERIGNIIYDNRSVVEDEAECKKLAMRILNLDADVEDPGYDQPGSELSGDA